MFSLDRLGKRVQLPGAAPKPVQKQPQEAESPRLESLGREYVTPYVQEEIEKYKRASRKNLNDELQDSGDNRSHCDLSEVDSMTIGTSAMSMVEEPTQFYKRYNIQLKKENKRLKVYESKDEILNAIEAKRIVIIKGATGCGKTTQVPQFILEDGKIKNKHCSIVITQPRRIAAVSVATRVAEDLKFALGTVVGYQIGLDKKADDDTRILYVTTGVLLHKLIKQKDMKEFTHYIIDEIHERDQDMDFLLLVARKFLNLKSKDAKLILMSATIDTGKFHDYLITYYGEKLYKPQIVSIQDSTPFKVVKFFINDFNTGKNRIVEAASLKKFSLDNPEIQTNAYRAAARIILGLDKTEQYEESSGKKGGGAVLVFLPGLHEIQTMEKTLYEVSTPQQRESVWILPLHSSITADEQKAVFMDPPASKRKVILSTNIAESSVTVTDIVYVIDFCLTKALRTDLETGCTSLQLLWASKNSLIQRAGRVGRVKDGRVYRMITSEFYERYLEQELKPEILRCPLETLVLKAKLLGMGPPEEILALAMDQPDLANIHQAVARLKEIGALLICVGDEYTPADGDLTLLGEVIATLPIDVRLGKLIFLGNLLGVPEESITMACAMSAKSLFSTPYSKELEAYDRKLWWANCSGSDCVAFLNAYKAYRRYLEDHAANRKLVNDFTSHNFLQVKGLREVYELKTDIERRLRHHELYSSERQKSFPKYVKGGDREDEYRPFFLKLAIAGAFYPNYFVRGSAHTQVEEKEVVLTLNGNDPFSTVFLRGLPPTNDYNAVFKRTIKKQFENICERLDVNMDNSSKAYVTFRPPTIDPKKETVAGEETMDGKGTIGGKICMPVYLAIKMKQIGTKFTIPRLKLDEIMSIHNEYVEEKTKSGCDEFQNIIRKLMWPWRREDLHGEILQNEILEVRISHVESPQKFWIQSSLKFPINLLYDMVEKLNEDNVLVQLPTNLRLPVDSTRVYLAKYDHVFYRCRIIARNSLANKYTIYFLDYGYTRSNVSVSEIYDVDPAVKKELFFDRLPDLAIECSLVKIQPATEKLMGKPMDNVWSRRAIDTMKSYTDQTTIAKVYSVVSDVVRVKLVQPKRKLGGYNFECTVNHTLLKDKLAEKMDEDYLSLVKHQELKQRIISKKTPDKDREFPAADDDFLPSCAISKNRENEKEREEKGQPTNTKMMANSLSFDDLELPVNPDYSSQINLDGPYSPLEMKVFSLTKDLQGKTAAVERDSVNSVLLDSDPSNPKEKMLVAAYVGLNPSKNRLNLKHTTIMPSYPALPMLCCLTFAPMVQMRVNPAKTKYCGALCGLGYNRKTGHSFYPADDVSITFDYEITNAELELINKIRFNLSVAVNPSMRNSKDHFLQCRQKLREYLKKLFLENRYQLQETYYTDYRWNWGSMKNEKLMSPLVEGGVKHPAEDFSFAYRLIWAVPCKGDQTMEYEVMKNKLAMLGEFSTGCSTVRSIECPLCRIHLENPTSARLHLKVASHRVRERRYSEQTKLKASG